MDINVSLDHLHVYPWYRFHIIAFKSLALSWLFCTIYMYPLCPWNTVFQYHSSVHSELRQNPRFTTIILLSMIFAAVDVLPFRCSKYSYQPRYVASVHALRVGSSTVKQWTAILHGKWRVQHIYTIPRLHVICGGLGQWKSQLGRSIFVPRDRRPMTSLHLFLTARATSPDAWLAEKVRRKKNCHGTKIQLSNKKHLTINHFLVTG